MSKQLTLRCSQQLCAMLADILRDYANAAYPHGGSECSQSARETLLTAADSILHTWESASQTAMVSKRLRVMMKSAISYYAQVLSQHEGVAASAREAYLLSALQGEVIDHDGYHAAELKDRA